MLRSCRKPPWLWLLVALFLLPGCASRYFRSAGPPPAEPARHALADLRWHEYWTGIIFNRDKVGFTHTALRPIPEQPGQYQIHSEASLLIRLLGFRKRIQLRADDVINADLTLVRFDYEYNIDGNALQLSGTQSDGWLRATVHNAGRTSEQVLHAASPIYPASALDLYPVVNGLRLGAEYRFTAYSGETQSLLDVHQSVEGYESSDLFLGNAFKVRTSATGHNVTTWIDASGKPLLELALEGVMMSALEGESEAKRYLALAALNKRDTLIDFSLVKPDRPIADPRHTTRLRVAITGAPTAPSASAEIRQPLSWIQKNIERAPVDSFSALDVLPTKQAECQGHAYLYTAFARSLGIPTRVVSGLVYSEQFKGFLYHSWSESVVDGRWQAVDPSFGQTVADATHIMVVEGDSAADLLPLIDWVGKVRIRVLAIEPAHPRARLTR